MPELTGKQWVTVVTIITSTIVVVAHLFAGVPVPV